MNFLSVRINGISEEEMKCSLIDTFEINVDNTDLTDKDFRDIVRNSLQILIPFKESLKRKEEFIKRKKICNAADTEQSDREYIMQHQLIEKPL